MQRNFHCHPSYNVKVTLRQEKYHILFYSAQSAFGQSHPPLFCIDGVQYTICKQGMMSNKVYVWWRLNFFKGLSKGLIPSDVIRGWLLHKKVEQRVTYIKLFYALFRLTFHPLSNTSSQVQTTIWVDIYSKCCKAYCKALYTIKEAYVCYLYEFCRYSILPPRLPGENSVLGVVGQYLIHVDIIEFKQKYCQWLQRYSQNFRRAEVG